MHVAVVDAGWSRAVLPQPEKDRECDRPGVIIVQGSYVCGAIKCVVSSRGDRGRAGRCDSEHGTVTAQKNEREKRKNTDEKKAQEKEK
jgi:hypothetical protein